MRQVAPGQRHQFFTGIAGDFAQPVIDPQPAFLRRRNGHTHQLSVKEQAQLFIIAFNKFVLIDQDLSGPSLPLLMDHQNRRGASRQQQEQRALILQIMVPRRENMLRVPGYGHHQGLIHVQGRGLDRPPSHDAVLTIDHQFTGQNGSGLPTLQMALKEGTGARQTRSQRNGLRWHDQEQGAIRMNDG